MATQSTQNSTTEANQETTLPIAEETTKTDQKGKEERPNKYIYPIFDGFSGERYLDSIILDVLPSALARTWRLAVEHQAPGRDCYVGAGRIAGRAKRSLRKIEIDLRVLEVEGLMRKYAVRRPIMLDDGTFVERAVVVKDFQPLYDLAYEYHLWTQSPEYIPPERDYAEIIRSDPQLYQKLIRFNNYRRMLCCDVPGRKTQTSYQCNYRSDQAQDTRQPKKEQGTPVHNTKNYFQENSHNPSPYRRSEKNQIVTESVSISTEDLEARTIGNQPDTQHIETEAISHNIDTSSKKQEETVEIKVSKSKPVETPQEKEMSRESAKDEIAEKEYTIEDLKNNPMAMTAFLLDLHAQQIQQPEKEKRSRKQKPQRKRRGTPERLATTMVYIAQTLGGNPKFQQSDVTRITKLYWAATQIFNGFSNAWFLDMIQEAFIKVCNTRGVKRRVPYFFTCLEDKLELTPDELVFIRSQEPLYTDGVDIHSFKASIRKAYEKSGTNLEYLEWVQQTYLR